MKKTGATTNPTGNTKKGYNEKNPGQPEGAFPPDAAHHQTKKSEPKSNAADKKKKENQQ